MKEKVINYLLNRREVPIKSGGEIVAKVYLPRTGTVYSTKEQMRQKPEPQLIMYKWSN